MPEVEVLHWNGVPVRRAVEANARRQGGSNEAASFARGLDALTIRPLLRSVPPDEDWVVVTYRGLDGVVREIRLDWQVAGTGAPWKITGFTTRGWMMRTSSRCACLSSRIMRTILMPPPVEPAQEAKQPRKIISTGAKNRIASY